MTTERLINSLDNLKPNAYTMEQKNAWIADMEAEIWREIFLQSSGDWEQTASGPRELLLPDGYKRLYIMYLTAMIDFSNGEYTKYSNAMTAYNSALQSFAAQYAEKYAPADNPAFWANIGVVTYNVLSGSCYMTMLPDNAAVLAAVCTVTTAFNATANSLCLGTSRQPDALLRSANITAATAGGYLRRGLFTPGSGDNRIFASYAHSGTPTAGAAEFAILIQPGKGR